MNNRNKTLLILFLLSITSACSTYTGRYQQKHDSTPSRLPTAHELEDATFKLEPKSKGGNKNYTVYGVNYQVLDSAENYQAVGIASYYGNKFHGHLTSNGEIYNMYSMSAAHKSLPLPSYVKVTNLDNNKSVIVRVNDRGPFHKNRLIDLSYSAAYKLDMLKTGTAKVKITAITQKDIKKVAQKNRPSAPSTITISTKAPSKTSSITAIAATDKFYIQVLATRNKSKAQNTANALSALYQQPVTWQHHQGIFKVQIGPIKSSADVEELLTNLKRNGYPRAFRRKSNS